MAAGGRRSRSRFARMHVRERGGICRRAFILAKVRKNRKVMIMLITFYVCVCVFFSSFSFFFFFLLQVTVKGVLDDYYDCKTFLSYLLPG